jgi:sodium/bile acid cotransporter 7
MSALLGKHWFLILLTLGLGAALAAPGALHPVTAYWEPRINVALSLFLMAWTMPTRSLVEEVRWPYASLWAISLSYGLVPASAWLLGRFSPDDVSVGLILASAVPCTLSSAILWTRMAGGNEATALLTVMGTVFTSWLLTTAWLYWLTGAAIELNVQAMALDLVLSLILPVLAGQALRFSSRCAQFAQDHKLLLGVVSQCCILTIVLKAGVTVGVKLHEGVATHAAPIFLWSIALAVSLHLIALASGLWTSRWIGFDRGRQIAVAFSASQKTLPLSLMLYEEYFKEKFPFAVMPLLFYHIGQLLLDTVIAQRMARRQESGVNDQESAVDPQC